MGFWPVVLNVIRNSDVVLLLVDARMPEITRNSEIMTICENASKELIIVFNKIDLVGDKKLRELRTRYGDSFFLSGLKKRGLGEFRKYLADYASEFKHPSLRVGIVGYPNVGKSTLINLLTKSNEKVSNVSGTTKRTKWIRVGKIRYMDSPGVIPFGDKNVKVGLASAKDPHKLKNPEKVAHRIIEDMKSKESKSLLKFYSVTDGTVDEVFENIARKKGFLVKGGIVDEQRTAVKIIEDWQQGKIRVD